MPSPPLENSSQIHTRTILISPYQINSYISDLLNDNLFLVGDFGNYPFSVKPYHVYLFFFSRQKPLAPVGFHEGEDGLPFARYLD